MLAHLHRRWESSQAVDPLPLYSLVSHGCRHGHAEALEADLLALLAEQRRAALGDAERTAGLVEDLDSIQIVFAYLDREYLDGELLGRMWQLVNAGELAASTSFGTSASMKRSNGPPGSGGDISLDAKRTRMTSA